MSGDNRSGAVYINTGYGIGTIVACIMSWVANHSVLYCILHGFLGWFYVGYRLLFC